MNRNDDYPYIRAWGAMLHSGRGYIQEQVARARADKAPANATHVDHGTQQWNTTDDIISQVTRFQLGLPPIEPDAPAVMQHYGATPWPGSGEDGATVIGFPSLRTVTSWVDTYQVADRVRVRVNSTETSLSEPVTVVLQPARDLP